MYSMFLAKINDFVQQHGVVDCFHGLRSVYL